MTIIPSDILTNIVASIPPLTSLVIALGYIGGIYMMISSIINLKDAAYIRSPGQGEKSAWEILKKVIIASCLIYLPSTINAARITLFGNEMPYDYFSMQPTNNFIVEWLVFSSIMIMIGIIAIIRGLYEISDGGEIKGEDGQAHSLSMRGTIKIIGGILLINFPMALQMIFSTIGIIFGN